MTSASFAAKRAARIGSWKSTLDAQGQVPLARRRIGPANIAHLSWLALIEASDNKPPIRQVRNAEGEAPGIVRSVIADRPIHDADAGRPEIGRVFSVGRNRAAVVVVCAKREFGTAASDIDVVVTAERDGPSPDLLRRAAMVVANCAFSLATLVTVASANAALARRGIL